jgi:zinc protease
VQKFKLSLISITIITLIITDAWPQSGRGRSKVSPREATAPPPAPVKVPETAAVVKQEQAGATSRFVLRNGMTVIISEQHAVPIAAAVAYFKVGTADEPVWANGIARLLERVINETAQAGTATGSSIDARKIGAIIDSSTSVEGTSYQVVAPSEKIKEAIAIQANAVQNPSLEANAISRPPIYKTDSSIYAMARLLGVAFTAHPISRASQPTGSVTRENLSEFHNIYYRPDNLIVAVVGDVSTFDTLVEIQQLYGGFRAKQINQTAAGAQSKAAQKPGAPPAPKTIPAGEARQTGLPQTITATKPAVEPEQMVLRYGADRGDVSQSIVSVGFHVPGLTSKDRPALEVLAAILGQGRGSQLRRSLLDGQAVVNRVESNYLALREFGLLTVQMQFIPDSQGGAAIDKAESAFFKEIDRLRREMPAEAEMARAKSVVEKRFVDRSDTYLGRAREIATAEAATGGISSALDYRALIRAVRAEDVQRVAGRYLTLANTSLHEYEPAGTTPRTFDSGAFSKTVLAWASGLAQPVEQKDARAAENNPQIVVARQGTEQPRADRDAFESVQPLPVRDFSTLNGPRAFVREDHSQPKVAVAILFPGGRAVEDESGITELMLRSMLQGTARRLPAQVAHELDQFGATIRPVVEPDFFGFILDVFSHNADRAIRILRDVTEEPAFRDEDIKRAQAEQIGLIRESRDDGFMRSKELTAQSLFPAHPYSFPPHGREEVVAKLNGELLRAWHEITVKSQIPVAIIVGDTNGSALISGSLAEGFRRRDVEGKIKVQTPQPARPGEKVESRQRPMTVVTIGLPGPKAGSTELSAIELIESALKGNQKIAGDFGMDTEVGLVGGAIYAFLVTAPEDEPRARAAVLQEFERLARAGLTADEIEQAQAMARASRLASLQSHSERALEYARALFHQQQPTEVDLFADRLSKVTADDIKRAAASYFKPTAAAVGVVRGVWQSASQAPAKQD